MEDEELATLRAQRMAEMRQQPGEPGEAAPDQKNKEQNQKEAAAREEEVRNTILVQVSIYSRPHLSKESKLFH